MTYLFDLDNTLIDDDKARSIYLQKIFLKYKAILPYHTFPEFDKSWSSAIDRYYPKFVSGELTFEDQRKHRIKDAFHLASIDLPIVNDIITNFDLSYQDSWCLFDDTTSTLKAIKPHKIGLITNGDSKQQRQKITKLGIAQYFDTICISSELAPRC